MPLSINNNLELEAPTVTSTSGAPLCCMDIQEIEISASQQELVTISDAFNEVIKYYYLDGKGHSSLKLELIKQSGLFLTSCLGVMFYYEPTLTYAKSICADPTYKNIPCSFFIDSHVTGTLLVAGGILMVATNSFIDQQNAAYIPSDLKNYLQEPLSRRQKRTENAVTIIGSFIASIPFMVITVANPIPGLPKFLIFSQACIVGVTNTLLHLLPFKLAFKNKLYRAPFLPIEFIIQIISNSLLSEDEKQRKKLQEQINRSLQLFKQELINHFDQTKSLLSINGFNFAGCDYKKNAEVIDYTRNFKELSGSPLELLTQFLDLLHRISPNSSSPRVGIINNLLRKLIYLPGASWVILSCAGFWGGTFNKVTEFVGNPEWGFLVSAPSIYCLCVLLAFFGGNALQNLYDFLTAWNGDSVKISLAFKLYPKTSVLLIFISLYLSVFSYAAGAQLINDNFNDKLEFLRPYLLDLAKTGLTFLGFNAMLDLLISGKNKFGKYAGDADTQMVTKLRDALSQLENAIQLMNPHEFLQSLAKMRPDLLISIYNIKNNTKEQRFNKDLIQLAENLRKKIFYNFESKPVEIAEIDPQLAKLLLELKNDQFYTINKIEILLVYLTNSELNGLPFNLQDFQDLKNIYELIKTLKSINLTRQRNYSNANIANDEGYAGPSTERTSLIPSDGGRPFGASIQTIFFHPPRPPQFYEDENSVSYSQMI